MTPRHLFSQTLVETGSTRTNHLYRVPDRPEAGASYTLRVEAGKGPRNPVSHPHTVCRRNEMCGAITAESARPMYASHYPDNVACYRLDIDVGNNRPRGYVLHLSVTRPVCPHYTKG